MDRDLALPALVLLDEVGAGTDPVEGGALGTAVIDHFRKRGAHLVATTHYDSLKSYASTTEGVDERGVRLQPGDVRADLPADLRIAGTQPRDRDRGAARACRRSVIAAARENLSEPREAARRASGARRRGPARARAERRTLAQERAALADAERKLRAREESVREREDTFRRRLDAKLDDQLREARREIDAIIEGLKAQDDRAVATRRRGERRRAISTGETGAVRADARAALDTVVGRLKDRHRSAGTLRRATAPSRRRPIEPGVAGDRRRARARRRGDRASRQAGGDRRERQAAARGAARSARRLAARRRPRQPVERSTSICSRARDRCPS